MKREDILQVKPGFPTSPTASYNPNDFPSYTEITGVNGGRYYYNTWVNGSPSGSNYSYDRPGGANAFTQNAKLAMDYSIPYIPLGTSEAEAQAQIEAYKRLAEQQQLQAKTAMLTSGTASWAGDGGVVPIPAGGVTDTPIWDETACARYGEGGKLNPPCTDWGSETIPGWTLEKWETCKKKCTKTSPSIANPLIIAVVAVIGLIAAAVYFVFKRGKKK